MPQTNYLPLYTASYPILARVQKPGGVTVSTTVGAGDVPNKPTPFTATIQMTQLLNPEEEVQKSGGSADVASISAEEEIEEEIPKPRNKRK